MLKRLAAMLLCLALLPVSALAEAPVSADGVRFRLAFGMNPEHYPEDVRNVMTGLADLLDILTVEGELLNPEGDFDLRATLAIGESDRGKLDMHVFATDCFWNVSTPLLGDTLVNIDLPEVLEFALKTNSHLQIPLHRAAIFLSPEVHTSALSPVISAAAPVLFAEEGSRVIPYDALHGLALRLSDMHDKERELRSWILALASETGYDTSVFYAMAALPQWVETHVPADGVKVAATEDSEVWTAGTLTILQRETDRTGAQRLSLTLPGLDDAYDVALDLALQPDGGLIHFGLDLLITEYESVALQLRADGSLPVSLPVTKAFSLTWEAEGPAAGGDGVHLYYEGEPTADGVILRQMTPDRSAVMLTVRADVQVIRGEYVPGDPTGAVGVLSLNSNTLNELMSDVAGPLVRGILPLVAQAPVSFCQTMMDLLEHTGIFGMLTEGFDASDWEDGEGWGNEGWDEDWDDSDWDWDDGDWDWDDEWYDD